MARIIDISQECANKKCRWVGTMREAETKPAATKNGSVYLIYVCPKCGGEEFYDSKEQGQ